MKIVAGEDSSRFSRHTDPRVLGVADVSALGEKSQVILQNKGSLSSLDSVYFTLLLTLT